MKERCAANCSIGNVKDGREEEAWKGGIQTKQEGNARVVGAHVQEVKVSSAMEMVDRWMVVGGLKIEMDKERREAEALMN